VSRVTELMFADLAELLVEGLAKTIQQLSNFFDSSLPSTTIFSPDVQIAEDCNVYSKRSKV
jgi:hypothetical protein